MRDNPALLLQTVRVEEYDIDRHGDLDDWLEATRMSFHQACVAKALLHVTTLAQWDKRKFMEGRPT